MFYAMGRCRRLMPCYRISVIFDFLVKWQNRLRRATVRLRGIFKYKNHVRKPDEVQMGVRLASRSNKFTEIPSREYSTNILCIACTTIVNFHVNIHIHVSPLFPTLFHPDKLRCVPLYSLCQAEACELLKSSNPVYKVNFKPTTKSL